MDRQKLLDWLVYQKDNLKITKVMTLILYLCIIITAYLSCPSMSQVFTKVVFN